MWACVKQENLVFHCYVTSLPSFREAAGSGSIYLLSLLQISNSKTCQLASVYADNSNYMDQNGN